MKYPSQLVVVAFAAIQLMAPAAFAGILKLQPGSGAIENVPLSKGATLSVGNRDTALTTVGAGLRSKKVMFTNVKVYVAQLMVSDAPKFVRTETGALKSLESMNAVVIQLTFLREIDAQKVQTSFVEALNANQVDLQSPGIKSFLEAVAKSGDAKAGKTLTVAVERLPDGSEVLTYENNQGALQTVNATPGLLQSVFSIWLGTPSDAGVQALKKALLAGARE